MSISDPLTSMILEIENLKVIFHGDRGSATHAVDGLDLTIQRGQTLGLVGESGCGKTVTALSVMRLLPKASAEVSGRIRFDGAALLSLSDREMRNLRGDRLAMIFQEPMTSLNPSFSIGEQIAESLVHHRGCRVPRRGHEPSNCCGSSKFHRPSSASTIIRIGFPAVCGSAP